MPGINLASKFAKTVDERFTLAAQSSLVIGNAYEFSGVDTVKVYSIPVVPMQDYNKAASGGRYGAATDLTRNVQTMVVTKDRSFTFVIDKGDKIQSEMVSDAGKALSRQLAEVVVPEFDTYVFKTLANAAIAHGSYDNTAITKANAYEMFLKGMEYMGNHNVPDTGRVAVCTYAFANLLMQDPAFIKYSDRSQEMVIKGVLGEVDGCKIMKVPSGRLPAGCAFMITHKMACVAPKQLNEYKIHDNPPGISGWLVEGRFIYDCFTLNEKADAIYYHGGQGGLKTLAVGTAAKSSTKSTLLVLGEKEGAKRYYKMAATTAALPEVTAGTAITTSAWTELTAASVELTAGSNKVVRVVEVDAESKPLAVGDAILNLAE